jgi:hypothetical protein
MHENLPGNHGAARAHSPSSPGLEGCSGCSVAWYSKRQVIEKSATVVYRGSLVGVRGAVTEGEEPETVGGGNAWPAEQTGCASPEEQRLTPTDKVLFIGVES